VAKDKLTDYSATNGSNTDVGGINIDEGMLPSAVNNSIRELMTHLKNFSDGTDAIDALTVTGDLTVDTNTLHVDAANNRVGVGTTAGDAGASLTVNKSPVAAHGNPLLQVGGSTFTSGGYYTIGLGYTNSTYTEPPAEISYISQSDSGGTKGAIVFGTRDVTTNTAVTERLRILSGGGLTFNGDTAAANALNDYEEGTFTPSFSQGASGVTYSTQSGHYVKVGKLVHIAIYLDAASTSGTTSDVVVISGLPFATAVFPPLSSFTIGYANNFNPTGNPLTALGNSNNTTINLYEFDGTNLLGTETNFLHDLYISGSYVAF